MASEQAQAFIRKMQEDKELQRQVAEVKDKESSFSLMAEIGKSNGFDVTPEEIKQAWSAYQQNQSQDELSGNELDNVGGAGDLGTFGPDCH